MKKPYIIFLILFIIFKAYFKIRISEKYGITLLSIYDLAAIGLLVLIGFTNVKIKWWLVGVWFVFYFSSQILILKNPNIYKYIYGESISTNLKKINSERDYNFSDSTISPPN